MASVHLKRDTWYLRVCDAGGPWLCKASTAKTKTEAKRLAADIERRFERQLAASDTGISSIRKNTSSARHSARSG